MRILKCRQCGLYTLKDVCVKCNVGSKPAGPAKYSPEDPYGHYRRLMKKEGGNG